MWKKHEQQITEPDYKFSFLDDDDEDEDYDY